MDAEVKKYVIEKRRIEIPHHGIMGIEVGTNGFSPDNVSSNRADTTFKLYQTANTLWKMKVNGEWLEPEHDRLKSIEIFYHGDSELNSLIDLLEFATKSLKEMKL